MKRSELNKFIREQIISVLSEATDEEIKNQEEYNKELEKTIQLKKDAGIEEQEDEPTSSDLKRTKGLAKSAEDLARIQADMRSLAKKYSKATGQEKEDLLSQLKAKTKIKKELENILNKKL